MDVIIQNTKQSVVLFKLTIHKIAEKSKFEYENQKNKPGNILSRCMWSGRDDQKFDLRIYTLVGIMFPAFCAVTHIELSLQFYHS